MRYPTIVAKVRSNNVQQDLDRAICEWLATVDCMDFTADEKTKTVSLVRSQLEMMVAWLNGKSEYSPIGVELNLNGDKVECILEM